MNSLINVVAVSRIPASSMADDSRIRAGAFDVINSIVWEPIEIQVPGSFSINNKVENKVTIWETSLVFRTCEKLTENDSHYCYLAKLADGRHVVIGSYQRPYAVTTVKKSITDNVKDSQLLEVTVKHSMAYKTPIII